MLTKHAVIIALSLVVAIVGGLMLHAYISSRVDLAKLDQIRADVKTQIDELKESQAKRQEVVAGKRKIVAQKERLIVTPEAIRSELAAEPDILPIVIPPELPNAPSATQITAPDLKKLYDFGLECRQCKVELAAANATIEDQQKEIALKDQEIEAAVKAAKGGSFWQRFKRNALWFGIGGAVGAVAGVAATH